ncbi:MAG: hypothetical protein WCY41_06050, partial [Candidatus Micrarchaeia archaeon]
RQRRAPPLGAVFHAKNKREWGAFIQRLKALGFPRPRQLMFQLEDGILPGRVLARPFLPGVHLPR